MVRFMFLKNVPVKQQSITCFAVGGPCGNSGQSLNSYSLVAYMLTLVKRYFLNLRTVYTVLNSTIHFIHPAHGHGTLQWWPDLG